MYACNRSYRRHLGLQLKIELLIKVKGYLRHRQTSQLKKSSILTNESKESISWVSLATITNTHLLFLPHNEARVCCANVIKLEIIIVGFNSGAQAFSMNTLAFTE